MLTKKESFDLNPANYDKYRPNYPNIIYQEIKKYCNLQNGNKLLEIGIGTGQATSLFLKNYYQITAIELGYNLSLFVSNKFSKYSNIKIINDDFMTHNFLNEKFDLIYCASAFWWLDKPLVYQKIYNLLNENGVLAIFANHPYPNKCKDKTNIASKKIYHKYYQNNKKIKEFSKNDLKIISNELKEFGFKNVKSFLYKRIRKLSTSKYIGLINTYSDHIIMDQSLKKKFDNDMKQAINKVGGFINIYDTIDLYLAKK